MPIQIIDNFDLTSAKAIDNRIVVGPTPSFYHNKDDISNKYEGLRIWELPGSDLGGGVTNSTANGVAYVWNGSSWVGESTTSISGSGTVGRVPYFNSSNTIQDTNIYYNGTNIGIGASAESAPAGARLFVSGVVKSSLGFDGIGTSLTALNATQLTSGTMDISRMPGSTTGWFITADTSSSASYKNPNVLTVGYSQRLSATYSLWGQNFNGSQNVTGNMTLNGQLNRAMSLGLLSGGVNAGPTRIATIQFDSSATADKTLTIPISVIDSDTFAFLGTTQSFTARQTFSNGISVSDGSLSSPALRFSSQTNTGLYRPSTGKISMSLIGEQIFSFTRTGSGLGVLGVGVASPTIGYGLEVNGDIANRQDQFIGNNRYYSSGWKVLSSSGVGGGKGWVMKIESDGNLYLYGSGAGAAGSISTLYNQLVLSTTMSLYDRTSGSSANLVIDSSGVLKRSTSSIKYKTNIEDLDSEYARKIYDMRPVYYRSKNNEDNPNWSWWGLIAEELAEIDPRLVSWGYDDDCYENVGGIRKLKDNSEMSPSGVYYDKISVLLLKVIQDLRKEIDELKS